MSDLYEILGVEKDSTPSKIRAAYRALAKTHHPDKGGDPKKFNLIARAYAVLSNADKRQRYDETGEIDEPDKAEAVIIGLLGAVFNRVMAGNPHAASTDVPKEMLDTLTELETEHKRLKAQGEKARIDLVDGLTRISKHPQRNVVAEIMNARITEVDDRLKELDQELALLAMGIKALEGYEYRVDPPPEREEEDYEVGPKMFSMADILMEAMGGNARRQRDKRRESKQPH